VHQLDIKVLNVIDAWCNHEVVWVLFVIYYVIALLVTSSVALAPVINLFHSMV